MTGALAVHELTHLDEHLTHDPLEALTPLEGSCAGAADPELVIPCHRHRSRRTRDPRRRRRAQRRERHTRERDARLRAARIGTHLVGRGWNWRAVARLLCVSARTLRRWSHAQSALAPAPVGRPVQRSDRAAREAVIGFLDEHGPHVGVPTLRICFPALGRAELTDLVGRYRAVWRRRNRLPLRVLAWSGGGRAWAIDFTGPLPVLTDGDLASGRQLLWRAVEAATGEAARLALEDLFARHGPPLVLKCDNGSAFTSAAVRDLLAQHGVVGLYSPPHGPRYNGAIEAGIGALKDRTAARAARAGHAGTWTDDDLAGARAQANATARPWRTGGASADELWHARTPIAADERAAFGAAVEAARAAREEVGPCAEEPAGVGSEASVARCAIELALTQCGYLHYRRRSITPPIKRT